MTAIPTTVTAPMSATALSSRELIQLPSGLRLETDLIEPEATVPRESNKLAVLLHPWSWLGGTMNDA